MDNQGKKNDHGKLRLDLIPPEAIEALGKILTHGANKYGDRNWEKGMAYHRVYGAILRHLNAWAKGEINDLESEMPHLHHAFCELAFLVTYEWRGIGSDDIHQKSQNETKRLDTLWKDDMVCRACKYYSTCGITYHPKIKMNCFERKND